MAKQIINAGARSNDGTGDSLRDGARKINENFSEIYSLLGDGETLSVVSRINVGQGLAISNPTGAVLITGKVASSNDLGLVKIGANLSIAPDGTLNAVQTEYQLPTASNTVLGGVKVGTGLSINQGVLSANNPTPYSLPIASNSTLGGIKIGANLSVAPDGTVSGTASYSLPTATDTVLGGIKIGAGLSISQGVVSVTSTTNSSDRLVNGELEVILGADGDLTAPGDIFAHFFLGQTLDITGAGVVSSTYAGDLQTLYVTGNVGKGLTLGVDGGLTSWLFKPDGSITLPAGGDIVDSAGNSVLGSSGVDGLVGDTDFTPEAEGDVRYRLGINEDISLTIYQGDSGETSLGPAISLGNTDGEHRAGVIAIGNNDVGYNSKPGGVYIGHKAGWNSTDSGEGTVPQGEHAIAIGTKAAFYFTEDNSITLNATGLELNPLGPGLFVKPVRENVENTAKSVYYNVATGEMTYADPTGGTTSDQNIWIQTFESDSPATDIPGSATSVEYDSDGNIIALFVHYYLEGGNNYTSLAKFTSTGTKLWQVRYAGAGSTDGWGVAVDSQNNFIYVTAEITDPLGYDKTTITQFSLVTGSIIWSKIYDFGYASTSGVIDAYDGNAVFVGYANTAADSQVTVVKISGVDGSIIWAKGLDGQGFDEAYGMAVGPSGEVVVIGFMSQLGEAGDTEDHMLVAKYNSSGTLTWQKAVLFDTGYNCLGADADIDSLGNIYVCGQYQQDDGLGGYDTAMHLVKFDSSGVAQWSRRVVGDCQTFATSVVVGPDDYLYLSGITGNNATGDFICVVAKYQQNGQVAWQRLLDNVTTWSFGGPFFVGNGGGSNIAVKNDYVAIAGGFGDPGQTVYAMIAQFDTAGTMFAVDNWDFKQASFSGVLNDTASDITVTDALKTDGDLSSDISVSVFSPDVDTTNFLVPTIYRIGATSTGDITFSGIDIQGATTNNILGSINLVPNPMLKGDGQYLEIYPTTANDAPHIHIAAGQNGDLILGTDNTHVDVNHSGEVRIRTFDSDTALSYNWQFENDGGMIFPTLTVPISDNATPTGTGQTIKFSDPTQQAIIYGPASTVDNNSAERIIIQGAPGFAGTTGEGGDVYLWAGPGGDAGGNGGDIKIRAGRGQLTGSGGYLNFQAGQSNTGNGGWIGIESGSSNTYGNGGYITIQARSGGDITLRTYNSEGNTKEIVLNNAGTTTFPGAVVKSTIDKTGIADNTGPATALSDATFSNPIVDGNYGPFTLGVVTFTVVVTSGVAAYTVVSTTGNSTVGEGLGFLDASDLGGAPGNSSAISVSAINQAFTAIDLTRSINKLTSGNYTLANGVEGQIMYLVPQTGITPSSVYVIVANYRFDGSAGTDGLLFPFRIFNDANSSYFDSHAFCTLIFTDGAWQQSGGSWD